MNKIHITPNKKNKNLENKSNISVTFHLALADAVIFQFDQEDLLTHFYIIYVMFCTFTRH